ncbi:DeoR family transcriptional regulator [Oceanobacillus oncorhynchi subsp. incaldanensis]|uniref:DeoR/GlpR family DNA-binding transcription regulator n=1 Tax=Oceanobacillus TaxID=182709 RepID=UPI001B1A87C6|nr:DeoR/GlpR family DNA-binding transcription regulator [Oceanobacillus oncorhynchi]GIO20852.1 DeoR family transcriptional regulator [Oceanobacillus oncorhynchi subsp. incaldanensis]
MIPYERQEKILEKLSKEEILKIEELHRLLPNVSISTLRRDLKELEKRGKVVMLTGGAVKVSSPTVELSITAKQSLHSKEKEAIAELAARLINDGDVIYLDSGSTCTALLNKILDKKISIITTNASVLGISQEIQAEIIVLGGRYNPNISSLNGPLADNNIQNFYFDKSFIGANGIDLFKGASTPNLVEANKKKHVIHNSKKNFLLCDDSKFHVNSTVKAFDLNEVTIISNKYDKEIANVTELIHPD